MICLSTCFDMANQNLKDNDQFLIGLQNENQFFYKEYNPDYFTDNNTKFRGQERSCRGFFEWYRKL